jgi:hypothetical protein
MCLERGTKYHLIAIIDRNITHPDKKTGVAKYIIQRKNIQDY